MNHTFDSLYKTIDTFVQLLGLNRYAIYVFDYGAPIVFRLASSHPEQVTAIVGQNGNAYLEGLLSTWDPIRKYWEDPSQENREALRGLLKDLPDAEIHFFDTGHFALETHCSQIADRMKLNNAAELAANQGFEKGSQWIHNFLSYTDRPVQNWATAGSPLWC